METQNSPRAKSFHFFTRLMMKEMRLIFLILAGKEAGCILTPKVGVTTSKVQTVRVSEIAAFQSKGANKCMYFTENQAKRGQKVNS